MSRNGSLQNRMHAQAGETASSCRQMNLSPGLLSADQSEPNTACREAGSLSRCMANPPARQDIDVVIRIHRVIKRNGKDYTQKRTKTKSIHKRLDGYLSV